MTTIKDLRTYAIMMMMMMMKCSCDIICVFNFPVFSLLLLQIGDFIYVSSFFTSFYLLAPTSTSCRRRCTNVSRIIYRWLHRQRGNKQTTKKTNMLKIRSLMSTEADGKRQLPLSQSSIREDGRIIIRFGLGDMRAAARFGWGGARRLLVKVSSADSAERPTNFWPVNLCRIPVTLRRADSTAQELLCCQPRRSHSRRRFRPAYGELLSRRWLRAARSPNTSTAFRT